MKEIRVEQPRIYLNYSPAKHCPAAERLVHGTTRVTLTLRKPGAQAWATTW